MGAQARVRVGRPRECDGTYHTARPVYEHSQDKPTFCGRACAQMVISSLIQGPPTGQPPTAADEKQPIPFTQDELRKREQFDLDVEGSWFRHPDELLNVMRNAPELAGGLADWRLAVFDNKHALFAELLQALKGEMPAILNVYSFDHWVVIVAVGVDDATSRVNFMQMLDPLPHVDDLSHTYIDSCVQEGLQYVEVVEDETYQVELAALNLAVGDSPPPPGLTDYTGKFVALVYGRPNPGLLDRVRQVRQHIPRLSRLLASLHEDVARIVHDVRDAQAPYYVLSLFSPVLEYGVVGVFKVRQPLHFRFTGNPRFGQSLNTHLDQSLWWTRRRFKSLASPFFPFVRTAVDDRFVYSVCSTTSPSN